MEFRVGPGGHIRLGNRYVWVPTRPFSYFHLCKTTRLYHAYTF